MTIGELYDLYKKHPSVQTDTRKLKKGDIFFALRGDHFNGNQFAKQAVEEGVVLAVIDDAVYEIKGKTLLVEDSLKTLQALAAHHRKQLDIPVLAITGSNGKTTTKELIHAVLSTVYKTYTTEGNLNNHIGVPLTILKIHADAQLAVIEMGANHIGEIASYCRYADPTHGLITNCGKAHLEGFESEEGVRKGKGELFDHLRKDNHGFAFVMWDYNYLHEMSKGISGIIKYGTTEEAHVIGRVAGLDPYLSVEIKQGMDEKLVETKLVGEYNLPNVLAAVTVGKYFKVPETKIRQAIEDYSPSNSRSQLVQKGTNYFILDAYNANPSSMRAAIENFSRNPSREKILVLGAMAELGKDSLAEHNSLVELIGSHHWKQVVLVGGDFLKIKHPYLQFENAETAREWLKNESFTNTHFLVKGSRSMQMEKVVPDL
jgi:UDP-N-acetylmuramoyl-tripeptide--D-alanyl-D-alanine ligase